MKNKGTSALLAFFLGGLGIHQFYLGQSTKGIFYLLFCWTFIPSFIALIDFIILLSMSDDTFNLRYNTPGNIQINVNTGSNNQYRNSTVNNTDAVIGELTNKAIALYNTQDYDAALTLLKRAVSLQPYNGKLYFNLACIYSIKRDLNNCLSSLQSAIENGYSDFNKINTYVNLAWIRNQEQYKTFVKNGYHVDLNETIQNKASSKLDIDQLEKLSDLKKRGIITEEEFTEQKKRLLAST